jgi:hypothetical protein
MTYKRLLGLRKLLMEELKSEFGVVILTLDHLALIEQRLQTVLMANLDEKDDKRISGFVKEEYGKKE